MGGFGPGREALGQPRSIIIPN